MKQRRERLKTKNNYNLKRLTMRESLKSLRKSLRSLSKSKRRSHKIQKR